MDEGLLAAATGMQMVESVGLLPNLPAHRHVGVNMYVDDEGSIVGAPLNPRASELAALAGRPVQVRGDAFLARVLDDGDAFHRLDFGLADLSSSAPWVAAARAHAEATAQRERPETTLRRLQEERQAGTGAAAPSPGEALKQQGNEGACWGCGAPHCGWGAGLEAVLAASPGRAGGAASEACPGRLGCGAGRPRHADRRAPNPRMRWRRRAAFKRGDWVGAAGLYGWALEAEPGLLAARNNRAQALLQLERWDEAAADAGAVLEAEPGNVKALLRRAAARRGLGDGESAAWDLRAVLELQPKHREAVTMLQEL